MYQSTSRPERRPAHHPQGCDFTAPFPRVGEAVGSLPVRSCIVDGEAIVVDRNGLSVFELIRYRRHDHAALLCSFDLLELDCADLRRVPIEERKGSLAVLPRQTRDGIAFNQHYAGDGRSSTSTRARSAARASCRSRLGSASRP